MQNGVRNYKGLIAELSFAAGDSFAQYTVTAGLDDVVVDGDEAVGIDSSFLAVDGAIAKAPLGGPKTGANPTDRAKRGRNARSSPTHRASRSGSRTTARTATT